MEVIDESKLFVFCKNKRNSSGKTILITIDNPGAYNAMRPIIHALVSDERCKNIIAVISGVASKNFQIDFSRVFIQVRSHKLLFIADLDMALEENPPDIIICSISAMNGPEVIMLYSGESVFCAQKLYIVFDGWGTLGSAFRSNQKSMDTVDGFFCNDELAKKMIQYHLPEINEERVYSIGTPVIETIEVEKACEHRKAMRARFYLDEDVRALLFLGDISDGPKNIFGADPRINEITFEKTIMEMGRLAETHSNKKFALLLRPHPRDANKQELYAFMERVCLPSNLVFIDAGVSVVALNEVAYGADVIASICSTENFLAPMRGRRAIYLGYQGFGFGGEFLETIYGKEIMKILSKTQGIAVASSPEEFGSLFLKACSVPKMAVQSIKRESPVKRILNVVFEEKKH